MVWYFDVMNVLCYCGIFVIFGDVAADASAADASVEWYVMNDGLKMK